MKTLELIYFDAGGGHRAAAQALQAVMRLQRRDWQVRLVNLTELLDPGARFRAITGMAPEDLYNKRLARGWTLGLAQELKLLQQLIRTGHAWMLRRLQRHWLDTEPDLVVSLVPNFNRVLFDSLAGALPGVPYVTVLTDMADHPPNFWIEPGQRQWFVCGTPRAADQARALGHDEAFILRSSGMVIRPDFYALPELDRDAARAALGLDPALPTGLVMFGGQGSMAMVSIAERLADVQLVLMCGRNRRLADTLRGLPSRAPRAVVEFTPDVARHMALADFFIGKPGPGCISEALQMGLPVVTMLNGWTMPQERYNARWLDEQRLGVVCSSLRTMPAAVTCMRAGLDDYRDKVAAVRNRAVFEVPEFFARILDNSDVGPWRPRLAAAGTRA